MDNKDPIDLLGDYRGLPLALTKNGTLIAPLEWDYATWDRDSHRFIKALKSGRLDGRSYSKIEILLSGNASPNARLAAAQNQIYLTEQALPGPLK